jgi:putative aldouronate transport system substrate-binding protein
LKGFADLLGRGALTDITEYIESYGSNIKRVVPDYMMEAATVDGKVYAVPAFWADTTRGTQALTLRTDLLEKHGLETPKTAEDLINFMDVVTANWEGDEKPYMIILTQEPARFLHRTFETYPFTVVEQLIYISQEGEVKPWYLTDEFKQEAAFYETCYKKGYVHPDVLTIPQETIDNNKRAGNYLFRDGTGLSSLKDAENYGYTEDLVLLAPEKKDFADMAFRNDNVVPVTSSNPEDAVKFLDWIYASQENYDLFMYGVEGVHWTSPAEGQYESILSDKEEVLYKFANWMIGNVNYEKVDPNAHPTWVETHLTVNQDIEKSIALGFQFDATNVSTEYSNCLAEVKSSLYPVKLGLVNYDDSMKALEQNFKAAGIDAVIEEFQRQLDEWLASK